MKGEVCVVVGGRVQTRFIPHAVRVDEFVTPRDTRPPPVPAGALLYYGGEVVGKARCVRREQFSRWVIVYDPVERAPGTSLAALTPYLNAHTLNALAALGGDAGPHLTVEELAARTDTALLAVDGIGPARLREIRAACVQALK
jgi:hypothetical protein